MTKTSTAISAVLLGTAMIFTTNSAIAAGSKDIKALYAELEKLRNSYESRIAELETKLSKLEKNKPEAASKPSATASRKIYGHEFNPSIGVRLNGKFANYSESSSEIKGFGVGEEGERGREGLQIDESELNFSASVDDKFKGSLTAAIVREGGEDKIELEEAYVQTLPGIGLPGGASIKAGRALWTLGYMNEHHAHADDFADRPLPYRVFLNKAFNDDGTELSYVLPTPIYTEIGGGTFRGDDFPGGSANGEGANSYSSYARIGGDIGDNQSWRIGTSWLGSDVKGRSSNEDTVTFIGDSNLYITDVRYTWAPTGNAKNQEFTLQGEYFLRDENGTYNNVSFDDDTSGWYAQATYKFDPQWRVGYRYSELDAAEVPTGLIGTALDSEGHDPSIHSLMTDWTNSEFSRIRLQYNYDESNKDETDNQLILQYIMSLGAHGAHKY
jgi:hypothetical protein